ncbi:hypothetical protein Taro_030787 [Colocasia esculenta]|uniref:Secreted protein n=1 Tax=Colocasia esculenta TaxID=4460 RepID=A0A843VUZ0_COLES|nr:hypothetical protein [Colocasia esculenta]
MKWNTLLAVLTWFVVLAAFVVMSATARAVIEDHVLHPRGPVWPNVLRRQMLRIACLHQQSVLLMRLARRPRAKL